MTADAQPALRLVPPSGDLEADRLARVALARLTEPGDPQVLGLVTQLGPRFVLEDLQRQARSDPKVADLAPRLAELDPAGDLERAARIGMRFVIPGDEEWPRGLDRLESCKRIQGLGGVPVGLWVRGPLRLDRLGDAVAVVGSRSSTSYGDLVAGELGAGVARLGDALVSGAAFGIDQAAHRGALAVAGPTVAVLACGADRIYPPGHAELLRYIAEHGAVVSESPPGHAPLRLRFLSRNRVIAAITKATVVVEASYRSGALNTAHWAALMGRPVMGVPGPVTSAASQGVHQLIREGRATLVSEPAHVRELVAPAGEGLVELRRGPDRRRDGLTRHQSRVLEALPVQTPARVDSVAKVAGLALKSTQRALNELRELEMAACLGDSWLLVRQPSEA